MSMSRRILGVFFYISCFYLSQRTAVGETLGGELLAFNTPLLTQGVSYRQNICDRYLQFRGGEIQLRDALNGLALRPIIRLNEFFHYDPVLGIDPDDPGLMASLLDEIAERAGFTWRQSFAILERPTEPVINNVTWTFTDLLAWSVETYDVAINWWDQSVERMERGVAYMEPWFDGSIILIHQEKPPKKERINLFNWLRPFTTAVWLLTILTVIVSGMCHQMIEYLDGDKNERSQWQWFSDNFYLSWMNLTQNYEYAPNSISGRIFGISMGIWSLLMTATYTANLASLLVEAKAPAFAVDSIDQAIYLKIPICTYGNTNADTLIKKEYANAIRLPFNSELEAYEALRRGECGLVASYKDNWLGYQQDSRYNPGCDLAWVGRTVETIKSGFAAKADAGHQCSSLIRDVFNLHLTEMVSNGLLDDLWEQHRERNARENAINCASTEGIEEDGESRRVLTQNSGKHPSIARQQHLPMDISSVRRLKGGGNSAAASSAGSESDVEGERLTVEQMAGIFVMHLGMMALAISISFFHWYKKKEKARKKSLKQNLEIESTIKLQDTRRISFRGHGPIIGSAPHVNTYIQEVSPRNELEEIQELDDSSTELVTSNGFSMSIGREQIAMSNLQDSLQESLSTLLEKQNHMAQQMKAMMSMMMELQQSGVAPFGEKNNIQSKAHEE